MEFVIITEVNISFTIKRLLPEGKIRLRLITAIFNIIIKCNTLTLHHLLAHLPFTRRDAILTQID